MSKNNPQKKRRKFDYSNIFFHQLIYPSDPFIRSIDRLYNKEIGLNCIEILIDNLFARHLFE
ncbi:hypothetical protein DERP_003336 [Dermatophagoides pteronyssinus]|uniref:Uncharacterized protein n=1 Tax=Dermatophagoides pteronyssinus TaxID=6956 RepID=A0ABQ8JJ70_DERPT|nr:hypothetical protein DERP_003336 [Dermatophagoides pteronyssinus]